MLTRIEKWIAPPVFLNDEIKTRRAVTLHVLLLGTLLLVPVFTAVNWLAGSGTSMLLESSFVAFIFCWGMLVLLRRGAVTMASITLVVLALLAVTAGIVAYGSIRTSLAAGYLLVAMTAVLLFDLPGMIVVVVFASLAMGGLIAAENAGWLPQPDYSVSMSHWIAYLVILIFTTLVTYSGYRSLQQALLRAAFEIKGRKKVEELLHTSQEQLQLALTGAGMGMWSVNVKTMTGTVDERAADILGVPLETIPAEVSAWAQMVHPDDASIHIVRFNEHLAGRSPSFESEFRVRHGSGGYRWVSLKGRIVKYDQQDSPLQASGTMADITRRKNAENALRESEARFSSAFHANPDPISITRSSDGVFIDVNQAFCAAVGLTRGQALGHTSKELDLWVNFKHRERFFQAIHEKGRSEGFEVEYRASSGQTGFMLMSGSLIQVDGQECYLLVGQDITARKQAEFDLQDSRDELEQHVQERTAELKIANADIEKAMQLKDEFLANMSHELRTPLTAILGLSDVLQMGMSGELNGKQLIYIKKIGDSGRRLLELINDILDYSQLQGKSKPLELSICSLDEICLFALNEIKPSSAQKGQKTSLSITPEEIFLSSDGKRIRQVLLQLLRNACKFTPVGGEFGITVFGSRDERQITITVWDTGIGIRQEDQLRLFKPFAQLDARLSRQFEGVGLGLALTGRLVELLGGEISVDSVFGEGSRFKVVLPWVTV